MNRLIRKNRSGLSLVELLTVMAIMGIIASIAIPNFMTWQSVYQFKKSIRDVYSAFQLARLSAIRTHRTCVVVFNQPVNGVTYDYIVYVENDTVDETKIMEYNSDPNEKILKMVKLADYRSVEFDKSQGGGDGLTFTNNGDGLPAVAYLPNGLPRPNSGVNAQGSGTVFLKNKVTGTTKSVILSLGGRVRIAE